LFAETHARHLLIVLAQSIAFQVNRDVDCPPGVTSAGSEKTRRFSRLPNRSPALAARILWHDRHRFDFKLSPKTRSESVSQCIGYPETGRILSEVTDCADLEEKVLVG
jgi:hypothetical protein